MAIRFERGVHVEDRSGRTQFVDRIETDGLSIVRQDVTFHDDVAIQYTVDDPVTKTRVILIRSDYEMQVTGPLMGSCFVGQLTFEPGGGFMDGTVWSGFVEGGSGRKIKAGLRILADTRFDAYFHDPERPKRSPSKQNEFDFRIFPQTASLIDRQSNVGLLAISTNGYLFTIHPYGFRDAFDINPLGVARTVRHLYGILGGSFDIGESLEFPGVFSDLGAELFNNRPVSDGDPSQ